MASEFATTATSSTPTWLQAGQIVTPEMTFSEAAELWLRLRTPVAPDGRRLNGYIRENTERDYERKLRAVSLFFGKVRLCDVRLDHLTTYQRARLEGAPPFIRKRRPHDKEPRPCPAKPKQINQELGLLTRILKNVHLWGEAQSRLYEELKEGIPEIPRALTPEQQRRWLDAAASSPRWNVVQWYSLLAFDTCMSTNEIRSLKLGDVNLQQRVITVPVEGAKNYHRHRTIPIVGPDAMWALECLIRRAYDLGCSEPHHYLFPFKITRSKECMQAQAMTESGIKKIWQEVRKASGLTWFRMYDCRHTAITRLAEAGTPLIMIMKRAGHVSAKMTDHYTHISEQSQVHAVQRAQQYNRDRALTYMQSRSTSAASYVAPPPPQASLPQTTGDLLSQMLRTMQHQLGITPEQLLAALQDGAAAR